MFTEQDMQILDERFATKQDLQTGLSDLEARIDAKFEIFYRRQEMDHHFVAAEKERQEFNARLFGTETRLLTVESP